MLGLKVMVINKACWCCFSSSSCMVFLLLPTACQAYEPVVCQISVWGKWEPAGLPLPTVPPAAGSASYTQCIQFQSYPSLGCHLQDMWQNQACPVTAPFCLVTGNAAQTIAVACTRHRSRGCDVVCRGRGIRACTTRRSSSWPMGPTPRPM